MILGIPKPVSVSFCANGINRSKRDNLELPMQLEELVEAAKAARETGAAVFFPFLYVMKKASIVPLPMSVPKP